MIIDSALKKLLSKYAELNSNIEDDEAPVTRRYPQPTKSVAPFESRPKDVLGVEHIIKFLLNKEICNRGEAEYFFKLLDAGESPKNVLFLIKNKIEDVQKKVAECKKQISDLQHLIK